MPGSLLDEELDQDGNARPTAMELDLAKEAYGVGDFSIGSANTEMELARAALGPAMRVDPSATERELARNLFIDPATPAQSSRDVIGDTSLPPGVCKWEVVCSAGARVLGAKDEFASVLRVELDGSIVYGRQEGDWVVLAFEFGFMQVKTEDGVSLLQVNQRHVSSPFESSARYGAREVSGGVPQFSGVADRRSDVGFLTRLGLLISMEEGVVTLAHKLYLRFDGEAERLPEVLQLLDERWGFPSRLFPLLWTYLRRAAFRCRGNQVQICTCGAAELPRYIELGEWTDALSKWLTSLHARCGHIKLSRRELVRSTNQNDLDGEYLRGPKIGEGAYGEVFVVFHKELRVERVAKVIHKDQLSVKQECARDEVSVLRTLDHPHIVRIYEAFEMGGGFEIIMDYAEGGHLAALLHSLREQSKALSEGWVSNVGQQICSSLEYMHSKGVIHCDLKPANTMILKAVDIEKGDVPHILLVDFGLSEICLERQIGGPVKLKGTPSYLSPEAFDGEFSEKSDMWAFGVMLFEMLKGHTPFSADGGNANVVVIWSRVATTEPRWEGLSSLAQDLIQGLLVKDAITRFTARECGLQEWFACATLPFRSDPLDPGQADFRFMNIPATNGHIDYFRRAAMFAIATGLSMKDMGDLFKAFETMDTDRSGHLSPEQFAAGLDRMGINDERGDLMHFFDLDHNGHISYTEFLAGILDIGGARELPEGIVREAFQMFDLDGDGSISAHELRIVLSGDGPLVEVLPDGQTIDEIMKEVGNASGRITLTTFMKYLHNSATTSRGRVAPHCDQRAEGIAPDEAQRCIQAMLQELDQNPPLPRQGEDPTRHDHSRMRGQMDDGTPIRSKANSDLPHLHRWLLENSDDPDQKQIGDAVRLLLDFPDRCPDVGLVTRHLYGISKHFLAGIALARQLASGPDVQDDKALHVAVAAAAAVHAARPEVQRRPQAHSESPQASVGSRRITSTPSTPSPCRVPHGRGEYDTPPKLHKFAQHGSGDSDMPPKQHKLSPSMSEPAIQSRLLVKRVERPGQFISEPIGKPLKRAGGKLIPLPSALPCPQSNPTPSLSAHVNVGAPPRVLRPSDVVPRRRVKTHWM